MTNSDPNQSIWLSHPNFALTIVGAVLFSIPMIIQFIETIMIYKSYSFIVVLIGACLEVGGYIARAVSIKQPASIVCPTEPPFLAKQQKSLVISIADGLSSHLT